MSETKIFDLMPGDIAIGGAGDQFKTLLGSCVSIILTDPRRTVGAMCHIVHVGRPPASQKNSSAYGDVALRQLFDLLSGRGIVPALCQAYVYGGGNMFPHLMGRENVGTRNGHWAEQQLKQQGIKIMDSSLGDFAYRKVSWTVGQADPLVELVSVQMEPLA